RGVASASRSSTIPACSATLRDTASLRLRTLSEGAAGGNCGSPSRGEDTAKPKAAENLTYAGYILPSYEMLLSLVGIL
ncbi:hypothetical protein Z043_111019, partial [Scleropages formosus]